jgi:hypothetical protein
MAGASLDAAVGDKKFNRPLQLKTYKFSKLRHTKIPDTMTETTIGS